MYYIPRRFFQDFINIAGIFATAQVFHEIALPTIWNIIDNTYSAANPSLSISGFQQQALTRWTDCWGNCCKGGAIAEDLLEKRCGHHLDFLNWDVTVAHFDRLAEDAKRLGGTLEAPKEVIQTDKGPLFRETSPADDIDLEDEEKKAMHRFMMI